MERNPDNSEIKKKMSLDNHLVVVVELDIIFLTLLQMILVELLTSHLCIQLQYLIYSGAFRIYVYPNSLNCIN